MSCVSSGWLVPTEVLLLVRMAEAVREDRTGEDFDAGTAEHVFRRSGEMMTMGKVVDTNL